MASKAQALYTLATKLLRIFYDHRDSQFCPTAEIAVINLIETSGYFAAASVMSYERHMIRTTTAVPSIP